MSATDASEKPSATVIYSEQAADPGRARGQSSPVPGRARIQWTPSIRRELLLTVLVLALAIGVTLLCFQFGDKGHRYAGILFFAESILLVPALSRALLRTPLWSAAVELVIDDSGVAWRSLFSSGRFETGAVLGAALAKEHLLLTLRSNQPSLSLTPVEESLSKAIASAVGRPAGRMGTIRFRVQMQAPIASGKRPWLALAYIVMWLLTLTRSAILWLLTVPIAVAFIAMLILSAVMLINELYGYAYLEVSERGLRLRDGPWIELRGAPQINVEPGGMRIVIGASAKNPGHEIRLWEAAGLPAGEELAMIKAVLLAAAKAVPQGEPEQVEASNA